MAVAVDRVALQAAHLEDLAAVADRLGQPAPHDPAHLELVHEGLKHAIGRVLGSTWQRCRVHWMRNALAHVPKGQHTVVAAALRQAFLQPDAEAARHTWRHVADQLRSAGPSSPR